MVKYRVYQVFAAAVSLMVPTALAQFSLGPAVPYGQLTEPSGMASGDFDGDGDLDLATTSDAVDRVVLFQNAGDGTFATSFNFPLPASSSPQDLIAGDLDGDMDIDLAVALRDPNGAVRLMLNNGSGMFTLGASVAVGDRPRGLSIADIDGDMDLDLAVANRDSNSMSILTNNGSGAFTAATVAVGAEPRATAMGNFLQNAGLEIAVTNHDDRTVSILDDVGGGFSPVSTLVIGNPVRPDGIWASNLDGEGLDDLAVATGSPPDFATVFTNNGAGFNGPFNYATGGTNSSDIAARDLNCNGTPDLVVSNTDSGNISLLSNNGNGTFAPGQIATGGTEPGEIVIGDWDNDRLADIAVANKLSGDISVFINHTCVIAPADFNADGALDCADVDALVADIAAGNNTALFDITGDGLVNEADLTQWLADAGAANLPLGNPYPAGDANLDGAVDDGDFNVWNSHKFTSTAAWCSGDFNADGVTDGVDFNIWNSNKFTSAGGVSVVPEPQVALWLLCTVLALWWRIWVMPRRSSRSYIPLTLAACEAALPPCTVASDDALALR